MIRVNLTHFTDFGKKIKNFFALCYQNSAILWWNVKNFKQSKV